MITACSESSSYCNELLRTHAVQREYVLQMPHLPANKGCDAGSFAYSCMRLCGLTPPPPFFFFLFKDPRGHQSHRYHHHHMNSQSLESLQHTQNDLMSPQQVWATNGKRKQSTFQWQDLQVRIKCSKNSQYADQLCCICFSVLIVSFILCCFQTLYSSEESVDVPAQPVSVLNSKMSAECCRAASV